MGVMNDTQERIEPPEADARPNPLHDFGRLRRTADGPLAGVAGGLGRHFDVDPVIFRVLLVVLTITGGLGLLLYGAAWLLVPREDTDRAHLQLPPEVRTALLIGVGIVVAIALLGGGFGLRFGIGPWLVPVVVIGFVWWLVARGRESSATRRSDGEAVAPRTVARAPRRTGPILFWPTLALIVMVEGVLGLVATAGHVAIHPTVYPAAALTIVGVMLVVGAWVGRPGGLPLLGVLVTGALLATAVGGFATGARGSDYRQTVVTPTSSATLQSSYDMGSGSLSIDLTRLQPAELIGRTLDVHGRAGRVEVVVPYGVPVSLHGHIAYAGRLAIDGRTSAGFNPTLDTTAPTTPALTINADLNVGDIEVNRP